MDILLNRREAWIEKGTVLKHVFGPVPSRRLGRSLGYRPGAVEDLQLVLRLLPARANPASNNFAANDDEGFSYVVKQPENDEEEAQCQEALEECPVEAIGDDGEDS